jgi:hypothetical protein
MTELWGGEGGKTDRQVESAKNSKESEVLLDDGTVTGLSLHKRC